MSALLAQVSRACIKKNAHVANTQLNFVVTYYCQKLETEAHGYSHLSNFKTLRPKAIGGGFGATVFRPLASYYKGM